MRKGALVEYLITFLEGIVTFVSPCLLPLLPVYIAYFAGGVINADAPQDEAASKQRLRRSVICALGFVLGFTALFTLMGALTATVGGFFRQNQAFLDAVCGIIVIVFGLNYAGVFTIPILQRTIRPESHRTPRGFWSSVLFGIVFSIGWTPCVGAFLGSALSLAASTGSVAQGVGLLICYSLGLGIPFILAAVLIDRLEGAFTWVKHHYRVINIVCGILLVIVGVLMATGRLGLWLAALSV